MLLVVVGYALGPAILAKWMPGLPGTGVMALGFALTAAVYAPVVATTHSWPSAWPSSSVTVSVVLLAVVCSAGAFTVMAALVAEVGPVRATTVTYVNPAVALIAGAVVLGEPVTAWAVVGFALILAGLLFRDGPQARSPRPRERRPAGTRRAGSGAARGGGIRAGAGHLRQGKRPDYGRAASAGIGVLQSWYSRRTGLWKTTGWWNSANALTAVIRYTQSTGDRSYLEVVENTFAKAQRGFVKVQRRKPGFINDFFDDNLWWALAWVAAFDLTGDARYRAAAQAIFAHSLSGWDDTCGGGLWWNEKRDYKNAITNELFLTLAALLAARVPGQREYRDWALREWEWLHGSGLIGPSGLVNDGLTAACANNGGTTWTYNQGVILGGLAALHELTGDEAYLRQGEAIADAALRSLTSPAGILAEPGEAGPPPTTATCRSSRASSSATCRTSRAAQASRSTGRSSSPTPTPSWRTTKTKRASSGCAGRARSTGRTPAVRRRPSKCSSPPPRLKRQARPTRPALPGQDAGGPLPQFAALGFGERGEDAGLGRVQHPLGLPQRALPAAVMLTICRRSRSSRSRRASPFAWRPSMKATMSPASMPRRSAMSFWQAGPYSSRQHKMACWCWLSPAAAS